MWRNGFFRLFANSEHDIARGGKQNKLKFDAWLKGSLFSFMICWTWATKYLLGEHIVVYWSSLRSTQLLCLLCLEFPAHKLPVLAACTQSEQSSSSFSPLNDVKKTKQQQQELPQRQGYTQRQNCSALTKLERFMTRLKSYASVSVSVSAVCFLHYCCSNVTKGNFLILCIAP